MKRQLQKNSDQMRAYDPEQAVSIRGEEMSLAEVGRRLGGIHRERVRVIEAQALRKLRHACEALGLEPWDVLDTWRQYPTLGGAHREQ